MTYRDSISYFRLALKNHCLIKGIPEPKLDDKEIMIMMSKVQCDIQSTHKVSMETKQIALIEGERTYNLSEDLTALVE